MVNVSGKEVIVSITDDGSNYFAELVNEDVGLSYYVDSYSKDDFDNEGDVLEYVITKTDGFGNRVATFLKTCEIFEILSVDNHDYLSM